MVIKTRDPDTVPSSREVISKRILELREGLGISASELARRVGVTPTAVWNWEKNFITPRRPALEAIAATLGVTATYLIYGKDDRVEAPPVVEPETETMQTPTVSVAAILDEAKARLAEATGLAPDRIKLNVQFGE